MGLTNAWGGLSFNQTASRQWVSKACVDLGDVNFFYVVNQTDYVFASGTVAPLWQGLSFVQAGKAYPVGGRHLAFRWATIG